MFPPETMHTTRPVAAVSVEGSGEGQCAGSLGDGVRAGGEQAHRGGGLVELHGHGAREPSNRALSHIAGSSAFEPAPSTNEGR